MIITVAAQANDTDIQPAIQAAVNSAVSGDRIDLPAGRFVVNSKVTIAGKFISFKGAANLGTTLYRSESLSDAALTALGVMFYFNTNSRESSNIIVENIYFKSQVPEVASNDGGSLAIDSAIELTKCVDFTVRNCRFDYFGNGAVSIRHYDDLSRGLIHSNVFYWNAKGWNASGLGYGVVVYGENLQWVEKTCFGGNNFIFIEDNTFDYHRHSIAGGGCGRYVARYNTITNNIIAPNASVHAIDGHAARGGNLGDGNYFSTRAVECYYNTLINTKYYSTTAGGGATIVLPIPDVSNMAECCIRMRGGELVSHNNIIQGYRFGMGINIDEIPWGTTLLPYSAGYISRAKYGNAHTGQSIDNGDGDCFHWNNTFTAYDDSAHRSSSDFHDYAQGYFVLNRDYHLSAKTGYVAFQYPHPKRSNSIFTVKTY